MPEPFNRLRWPVGLSSMEILWVWLEVRIEREKKMSLSASERGQARPLGLITVSLPWLYLTQGSLEPFVGRPSNLGQLPLISNEANTASWGDTRC